MAERDRSESDLNATQLARSRLDTKLQQAGQSNVKSIHAFSLIELLVVLFILAVLAALLFPSLHHAKANARKTACVNNVKQIGMFVRLYSDDSNDECPKSPWTRNSYAMYLDGSTAFKGLLGNPDRSNLFRCPADRFFYRYGTNANGGFVREPLCEQSISDYSSYGFNGGQLTIFGTNTLGIAGRKLSSIRNPTETVLVAELSAYLPWSWHQPKPGVPLFKDAKNVVGFVDGHTSCIKIYWNSNTPSDFALQYDPPTGYGYKWSGD